MTLSLKTIFATTSTVSSPSAMKRQLPRPGAAIPRQVNHQTHGRLCGEMGNLPSSEMAFCTLEEFNEFCAERVRWLNAQPFSAKKGSRLRARDRGATPTCRCHLPSATRCVSGIAASTDHNSHSVHKGPSAKPPGTYLATTSRRTDSDGR